MPITNGLCDDHNQTFPLLTTLASRRHLSSLWPPRTTRRCRMPGRACMAVILNVNSIIYSRTAFVDDRTTMAGRGKPPSRGIVTLAATYATLLYLPNNVVVDRCEQPAISCHRAILISRGVGGVAQATSNTLATLGKRSDVVVTYGVHMLVCGRNRHSRTAATPPCGWLRQHDQP